MIHHLLLLFAPHAYISLFHLKFIMLSLKAPFRNVEIYRSQVCNVTAIWVSFDLCPLCLRASQWIYITWGFWENHIHTLWQNYRNMLVEYMFTCMSLYFDFVFPQASKANVRLPFSVFCSTCFFRCASISWFEVVSESVSHLPFSASASTGLSELFYSFPI